MVVASTFRLDSHQEARAQPATMLGYKRAVSLFTVWALENQLAPQGIRASAAPSVRRDGAGGDTAYPLFPLENHRICAPWVICLSAGRSFTYV